MQLSDKDIADLKIAKEILENPGLVARVTNFIGMPIEKGFELLPSNWRKTVGDITRDALMAALKGALLTMDLNHRDQYPVIWKMAVGATGGVGGWFGLPALAIELPISTTIMLRSIADIGRFHGEDLTTVQSRIACLEVLALGGQSKDDDASESAYFAVRGALAKAVTEAAEYVAEKGVVDEMGPILVRLIAKIAARFEVQVSEKAAAMAVPIIGAAGGSVINVMFIDHFQDMSQGHFTVRKFERKYGPEVVRDTYDSI